MVTHEGFGNSDISEDANAMFPIDRLHELVSEDFIGSLRVVGVTPDRFGVMADDAMKSGNIAVNHRRPPGKMC